MNTLIRGDYYGCDGKELYVSINRSASPAVTAKEQGGPLASAADTLQALRQHNNSSRGVASLLHMEKPEGAELKKAKRAARHARNTPHARAQRNRQKVNMVSRNVVMQGLHSRLTPAQKAKYLRMYSQGFRPSGTVPTEWAEETPKPHKHDDTARSKSLDSAYWAKLDNLNKKKQSNFYSTEGPDGGYSPVALAMTDFTHQSKLKNNDTLLDNTELDHIKMDLAESNVIPQERNAPLQADLDMGLHTADTPPGSPQNSMVTALTEEHLRKVAGAEPLRARPARPQSAASVRSGSSCPPCKPSHSGVPQTLTSRTATRGGRRGRHLAEMRQEGLLLNKSTGLEPKDLALSLGNIDVIDPSQAGAVVETANMTEVSLQQKKPKKTGIFGFLKRTLSSGKTKEKEKPQSKLDEEAACTEFYRRKYAPGGAGDDTVVVAPNATALTLSGGHKIYCVDHSSQRNAWRNPYRVADQRVPVLPCDLSKANVPV